MKFSASLPDNNVSRNDCLICDKGKERKVESKSETWKSTSQGSGHYLRTSLCPICGQLMSHRSLWYLQPS